MKLKYYLRGIGIGVVVTTLIFMVSISLHKNEASPKESEDKSAGTVADMMEETEEKETEKKSASKPNEQKNAEGKNPDAKSTEAKSGNQEEQDIKTADSKGDTIDTTDTADKSDKIDSQEKTDTTSSKSKGEKVRFEIGGGEYSDVICRKLQQAKLIDNAEEFNAFLIDNKYDDLILPGVYDIPMGSSFEEIAKLFTTKVEED